MSRFDHDKLKSFAVQLYKINAIKFGEFKTKIGLLTPVYFDLRVIVSYPQLLETLADLISEYALNLEKFDIICGVPYTALPIATAVSIKTNIPMVMRRKEVKDYGTKKLIEGQYKEGQNCLIIEDVVTSGSSILETVNDLKNAGICCGHAVVLLNREQGGEEFLKNKSIKMHALLSLTQLMNYLKEAKCVNENEVQRVEDYLKNTQIPVDAPKKSNRLKLPFEDRIIVAKNKVAKDLFQIMLDKKTTLCLAADLTSTTDLLNLAEQTGPYICLFKTHIDAVEDFQPNFIKQLKEIASRHNFMLFEDRKFGDIGQTVKLQYSKSTYRISSWAPLVTAHSVMGQGTLEGLQQSEGLKHRGVFLLAEASSAGCLTDQGYVQATLKLAKQFPNLITGIVCQNPLFENEPGYVQLTPGCHLESVGDRLSQQYSDPDAVVLEKGADVAVVGRGITQAAQPDLEAKRYRDALWAAYERRISS